MNDKEIHDPRKNNILASLKKEEYERILPNLELVEMPLGWTISEAGDHLKFIHFPINGIASLIYVLEDGSSSETAMVGNEGMIGVSIYMGGESMPSSTEVQCSGFAYRLSRKLLKEEFALGGQLQKIALLYAQAIIAQISQTVVCKSFHGVEQQLCRWLLMSEDRLPTNEIKITQELISNLLGVRRESITEAAGKLQKLGMIARSRGRITILNRSKLMKHVCKCYETVTKEYERLLPVVKT